MSEKIVKTEEAPVLLAGMTFKEAGREMVVIATEGGGTAFVEVIHAIDCGLIDPHPKNRTWCDPEAQKELLESMREHGQSTPGILRPHPQKPGRYELIAGWRRWNAAAALGRTLQAVVRELDEVQALEQLYLENAQRENLRPLDEAELIEGMLALRSPDGGRLFSLERIALARYGTARPGDVKRVLKTHKLQALPEILRGPVNAGEVPLAVAFQVARIADPADREKCAAEALKDPRDYNGRPMTTRGLASWIAEKYQVSLKGWEHAERLDLLSEEERVAMGFTGAAGEAADGSCERCPFLAKNSALFVDELSQRGKKGQGGESGVDPWTCTRAGCHKAKLEHLWQQRAAAFATQCAPVVRAVGAESPRVMSLAEDQTELVELQAKPGGWALGNWEKARDPKLPTWEKILKGSGVPLLIIPNEQDEPVLACEMKLAVEAGRAAMPALFADAEAEGSAADLSKGEIKALELKRAAGEASADELALLQAAEEAAEQRRLEDLKQEMERAIVKESRADAMKELLVKLTEQGPGLAGARAMVLASSREHDYEFLAFLTGEDADELEERHGRYDIEEGLLAHLKGKTVNELLAIAAIAAVWDDVHYSGPDRASDFQALCEVVKLDVKAITARVKKAHQLAFKAREKARKEALKGPVKNSADPLHVSADREAEKTAAADARAKEEGRGMTNAECRMTNEAPEAVESVVDLDAVDLDAAVKALQAGGAEVGEFIGKKPHKQKEPERFKQWDALRNKILRRAGLK